MYRLCLKPRFALRTCTAVLVCMTIGSIGRPASLLAGNTLQGSQQNAPAASMSDGKMAHMYMTSLRPPKSGDLEKADAIVAAAKTAMAPYQDYRKALADGFVIFLPNIPQPNITLRRARTDSRHGGALIL